MSSDNRIPLMSKEEIQFCLRRGIPFVELMAYARKRPGQTEHLLRTASGTELKQYGNDLMYRIKMFQSRIKDDENIR